MALGFRPFTINLVLLILCSFFILYFVATWIYNTNPSSDILSSRYGMNSSMQKLNQSIDSFRSATSGAYEILRKSDPKPTDYIFLIFRGAFEIPISFLSFVAGGVEAVGAIIVSSIVGINTDSAWLKGGLGLILSLASGIISSALIFTLVFLVIKAIRTGETER